MKYLTAALHHLASFGLGTSDRYMAIRYAAASSLARTAIGSQWSVALAKELSQFALQEGSIEYPNNHQTDHLIPQTPFLDADLEYGKHFTSFYRLYQADFSSKGGDRPITKQFRKIRVSRYNVPHNLPRGRRLQAKKMVRTPSFLYLQNVLAKYSRQRRNMALKQTRRRSLSLLKAKQRHILRNGYLIASKIEGQALRNRTSTLRKLIPGGATLASENLVLEAADYITFLECQVKVLNSLVVAATT
ncbi:hypothetical protein O6H91_23G038300 [Diphasiastrum complanatum]|uniref:Uncharacterized protein n=1 Tax=Diphasiastrum complanatum TaxID=34168 RepID=A0ACC2A9P9_DIPCM|nr:hypothetical protein O6H91_23G038300 [Diphasiastrum complanatum]